MPFILAIILLSGISFGAFAAEQPPADPGIATPPVITKPWGRATAPDAPNGAVYATITGPAGTMDRLTAATCDVATSVELHTHERSATGVLHMVKVEAMDVSTDHPLMLAPGASHLMLMGLTRALIEGERITLTLTFAHAGPVIVSVPILGAGAAGPEDAAAAPADGKPDCCHQPPAVEP